MSCTETLSVPNFNPQSLARRLAPFLVESTAFKPLNTRFVATAWDNIPQPPADYYFTDIQEAIDSITDESPTNQYLILLFPGMYTGPSIFLTEEQQSRMKQKMLKAMIRAKQMMNGERRGKKFKKHGDIFDFSEFMPDAATTITLKPNVSLQGFGLPSATIINANMTFTPTALIDTVSISNLTIMNGDFTYINLTPLTTGANVVMNETAFFGGSINTNSLRMMDSFSFIGGFLGFAAVNFGPAGVHNIDHSSILFVGTCNFTGNTGLGLYPSVRFHAPGTLIEDGVVLTQGATMVLTGAFLQAYGAGVQMDTASFIYSSFSHINAASFNALNNSKIFASNTPMLIFPTLDATSGCDRTLCTGALSNVPSGLSQPITFASLGLPNYATNSYQVILNFQLTPAQVGLLVLPVFVQVDVGSMTTTGFNLSTNAVILQVTFTFLQPNITMQDPN